MIAGMSPIEFACAITFAAAGLLLLGHVVVDLACKSPRPVRDLGPDRNVASPEERRP